MQVTEISAQGLKREYRVVLAASDLASKLDSELADMKGKVRINGFRPGKVPVAHLKRLYGRSLMGDVLQNAVNEANRKIVEENGLRLALEPKVDITSDQAEVERAMQAKGDLALTIAVETLPKFEVGSFDDIELEKQVADVTDEDVEKSLSRLADQNRTFTPKTGDDAEAQSGDKLTIDFEGRMRGEPFEGGNGTGVDVVLGSETFIPGFEQQLFGAKTGDQRKVEVKFPDNYLEPRLAGQEASFDVTVKAIEAPGDVVMDDEFAKNFGLESLDALKSAIRDRLSDELSRASRDKLKRALLDALDKRYSFDLPEGLVSQEFGSIWGQVTQEQSRSGRSFEDENTTEDEQRAEYRRIAERRVRLGLLLADVGEKAGVKVDDTELTRALTDLVRQYPGREQQVWDYYRKNPNALAEVRAPIFEEKVVDHIVGQAKVTDKPVSREELLKVEEELPGSKPAPVPESELEAAPAVEQASEEAQG